MKNEAWAECLTAVAKLGRLAGVRTDSAPSKVSSLMRTPIVLLLAIRRDHGSYLSSYHSLYVLLPVYGVARSRHWCTVSRC